MRRMLILIALAVPACATSGKSRPLAAVNGEPLAARQGPWSVGLIDPGGWQLAAYEHHGASFVEGVRGRRYAIRVENPTAGRVEAVVTVDGRDVISGDPGDYGAQRGYIIEPYGHIVVEGFRRSMSEVAAFRFTLPEDSYSARRGTPEHVGVVGVALFRERAPVPMAWRDYGGDDERAAESAPVTGAPAAADAYGGAREPRRRRNLGTAYGEGQRAPAVEVPFQRADADTPDAILAMYYDDRQGLITRGIVPAAPPPMPIAGPQPFPSNRKFAPPP